MGDLPATPGDWTKVTLTASDMVVPVVPGRKGPPDGPRPPLEAGTTGRTVGEVWGLMLAGRLMGTN